MRECDVAVVGTGPGGYVAAIRAAQLGAKTAVVERDQLGGVCLNWGCIPTKTFIHTANLYREMQEPEALALKASKVEVDMPALVKRKDGIVKKLTGGVKSLLKSRNVDVVTGDARITAPGRIVAGDEELAAKNIIIATGSESAQIKGLETDGERVITSTEALDLDYVPKKVLVIGAGAIGAEFACIWNNLGADVCMVEMMPNVLPLDDETLTVSLAKVFKQRGMDVRTETTVKDLDVNGKGVHAVLDGKAGGEMDVDLVLVGIGRKLNSEVVTDNPDLGVQTGKRGEILVNEGMETNVPGVYAIGDVTAKTMLAHGASAEGLVAAENATGGRKRMDYRAVPACTFTTPEVARVGLTETKARAQGIDVKTGSFPWLASGRAMALNATEGMVKIVADAETDEVVGVHIMGAEAGELISAATIGMSMEATVEELAHTVQTHPTLGETIMEAAENYYGMGIHTPGKR